MLAQIIGTNRPGSNTAKVAAHVAEIYAKKGSPLRVLDLQKLPPEIFDPSSYEQKPPGFKPFQEVLSNADGVVVVMPEYNGSFPGVFKYFIDMLEFPGTFDSKPFAFVGLSAGKGGAMRPMEQFATLINYLDGVVYPETVSIPSVNEHFDSQDHILDESLIERIGKQAEGFAKFVKSVQKSSAE
jgi:NAD(P)H-dependent FMN reductase